MNHAIHYTIFPKNPAAHLYGVTLTVAEPDLGGQVFSLPAWIPGSYMIREFAKNIVQITATCGRKKVSLEKIDKHTWLAAPCDGPLTLEYEVYAWDLSVRTAHLDQLHGFFNGTSVFLRVQGQEEIEHVVDIQPPQGDEFAKWRVATAMTRLKAKRYGFGTYQAANYDELIDHPVEMGTFLLATFKAWGVQHDVVFTGKVPNLDIDRITADLQKICEAQIALFEPRTRRAPMDRYVFMTMVVSDGYGGLEHRASTALICSRGDLPVKGKHDMSEGYRTFLGLCSHEYFHTWNVKRIKPAAFAPYELNAESYTPLLWLFEGFTSYYDDLILVRSGVIDEATYLKLIAKTVNGVLRGSGRTKQSVAESSFDAWVKYYRQDENATNAVVSYYTKGSLVGLALDLMIRAETNGGKSLDDVMRALWQKYGRDFYDGGGRGVTEEEVDALFDSVTGLKLKRVLDRWVRGTEDLPLAKLLGPFGVTLTDERSRTRAALGMRTVRDGNDCKVGTIFEASAAQKAGLSVGDIIIAIDGLRVNGSNIDALLSRYRLGDRFAIHAFRRDELMTFDARMAVSDFPNVVITLDAKPASNSSLRSGWLKRK